MQRYETAWNKKDRAALKDVTALPPDMADRLNTQLWRGGAVQMQVRILSIDLPSERQARVTAVEERTQRTRGSAVTRRTRQTLVYDLERRDGEWKIVSINRHPLDR
jgi:hypothetical protein